ncbi:MAG TPA: glycosyl hydrolase, partial [Anaerolineae bacterium]|nr:glycosyl hydrolase [Anaerolineae bacterium]
PAQPAASEVVTATLAPADLPLEPDKARSRLGVGVPRNVTDFQFDAAMARQLGMGWYLDWHIDATPVITDGLEFAQLYAMRRFNLPLRRDRIAEALAANPGALWLAGNEPDVIWQDNQTPEQYAQLYHQLYTFVKTLDPSAQVAIAGVTQVTPLRLQYLEEVLAAYQRLYGQEMPVDVWNIHAFILREERDSWGVSIPPGIDVDQGTLWEIEDHDNLDLFRQQIVDFRRWMVKQGQRDKPLIVSEYGILMPTEYGFPPERVAAFMTETFDFLLNAADPDIGYPADGNRLVQRLTWYSLSDTVYPTSNLVDPKTGELTLLGQTFANYAASLAEGQ